MTTTFWQGLLTGFLLATVVTSVVWMLLAEWCATHCDQRDSQRVVPVVHTDEDEDDWPNEDIPYFAPTRSVPVTIHVVGVATRREVMAPPDYFDAPDGDEAMLRWSQ